ncbi:MAG: hypothetical protein AAGF23_20040, partial [Acidobacteriota bacterium]
MDAARWRRVEDLYYGALDLDDASRRGYLEEACADDAALRREVEGLLAVEADDGRLDGIVRGARVAVRAPGDAA